LSVTEGNVLKDKHERFFTNGKASNEREYKGRCLIFQMLRKIIRSYMPNVTVYVTANRT